MTDKGRFRGAESRGPSFEYNFVPVKIVDTFIVTSGEMFKNGYNSKSPYTKVAKKRHHFILFLLGMNG